jgi:hypothetical protein
MEMRTEMTSHRKSLNTSLGSARKLLANWRTSFVLALLFVGLTSSLAAAAPTEDEVFKSINQNVDSTVDFGKAVPYLLVCIAIAILGGLISHYRRRPRVVKRSQNNPAKLTREVAKDLRLKSIEVKQLKIMAEEQDLIHPLTLLLCPSALGKGVRSRNPKLDRESLNGIVQRMRQSLSEQKPPAPKPDDKSNAA